MPANPDPTAPEVRGQTANPHSAQVHADLAEAITQTTKLWRRHHLDYDQTKCVVEQARRQLQLAPPRNRQRTVARLDGREIQQLIHAAYRQQSQYGLLVKTLFYTGARVDEFRQIRLEDLFLDSDPPQIHLTHAKRQATRYVPIPPALAQELRTHLNGRRQGYLFESNRHSCYAARTIQDLVKEAALAAGITKRVYPHLLRSQGMQANQQVTFLTDGGDNVRSLPRELSPEAEHFLDWFHLTMRLTVLGQCAKGLASPAPDPGPNEPAWTLDEEIGPEEEAEPGNLARTVESIKHYLWCGNVFRALQRVEDLEFALEERREGGAAASDERAA